MEIESVRSVLFEVIDERGWDKSGRFQSGSILKEVAERASLRRTEEQQVLLTLWHDLVRSGHIAWGLDVLNADPPFCHLTERGRKLLENVSRDPANPVGYFAYLKANASLTPVAESYIREALETYNSGCYKATAVMVGGASESLLLDLRDTAVNRLNFLGKVVPSGLKDWRAKRVIDAVEALIQDYVKDLPRPLAESFSTYYTAFAGQIRMIRNDAGHPKNVDPVSQDTVHSSLLIFPELAKMVMEIENWAKVNRPGYSGDLVS